MSRKKIKRRMRLKLEKTRKEKFSTKSCQKELIDN
jgi:hypothetical protein